MKEGRLGYNSYNKRYGLLSSDLWIDTGFHCGEGLEVLVIISHICHCCCYILIFPVSLYLSPFTTI